jgi:hypothetical protein
MILLAEKMLRVSNVGTKMVLLNHPLLTQDLLNCTVPVPNEVVSACDTKLCVCPYLVRKSVN